MVSMKLSLSILWLVLQGQLLMALMRTYTGVPVLEPQWLLTKQAKFSIQRPPPPSFLSPYLYSHLPSHSTIKWPHPYLTPHSQLPSHPTSTRPQTITKTPPVLRSHMANTVISPFYEINEFREELNPRPPSQQHHWYQPDSGTRTVLNKWEGIRNPWMQEQAPLKGKTNKIKH